MQVAAPHYSEIFLSCARHNFLSRLLFKTLNRSTVKVGASLRRTFAMESQVKSSTFDFSNYNCIGFDLDNTICRYKVSNLVTLEYEALSKFLIQQKNYSAEALERPVDLDFLQKGVILDFDRGNVIRVSDTGYIWKASHGTRFLSNDEIKAAYGEHQIWDVTAKFCKDPMVTWNGPLSEKLRSLLDYFDMPASLAFARMVDDIDKKNGGPLKEPYRVWPDVLDGLVYMFNRKNFTSEDGGHYFNHLKGNPMNYVNRCTPEAIEWLRKIKETKTTFLITGSHIDFASFTASNCLGPNWKELFDVVITFARKPFFFLGNRPFLELNGAEEGDPIIDVTSLTGDCISISQGNWQELLQLLQMRLNGAEPRCLYIGDNVVQDLVAPAHHTRCHTLAISEELWAEDSDHPEKVALASKVWDSYYGSAAIPSLWHGFMTKSSHLIIPNFETLATLPLKGPVPVGYYPKPPKSHEK